MKKPIVDSVLGKMLEDAAKAMNEKNIPLKGRMLVEIDENGDLKIREVTDAEFYK